MHSSVGPTRQTSVCCRLPGPFPRRLQGDGVIQVHHPEPSLVLTGVQPGAGGHRPPRVGAEEVVPLLQALWRRSELVVIITGASCGYPGNSRPVVTPVVFWSAGKQYTRFGCRRKADGKMVHRTFCSIISKPRAISRSCNSNPCMSPR